MLPPQRGACGTLVAPSYRKSQTKRFRPASAGKFSPPRSGSKKLSSSPAGPSFLGNLQIFFPEELRISRVLFGPSSFFFSSPLLASSSVFGFASGLLAPAASFWSGFFSEVFNQ